MLTPSLNIRLQIKTTPYDTIMKHTVKSLEAKLIKLAKAYKGRRSFNRAVKKQFPYINDGAFRIVCDAGNYAIKIRHAEEQGCFDMDDIDSANEQEADNYQRLMEQAPAVAFFVLAPIYIPLANGHDAILMRKVSVISNDKEFGDAIGETQDDGVEIYGLDDYVLHRFTPLMRQQYDFITATFSDSHDDNIGWDFPSQRVWYIDYNHGAGTGEDENHRRAQRIMKRVTQSGKKAKAA